MTLEGLKQIAAKLIQSVEAKTTDNGEKGKIDTKAEESIFQVELNKYNYKYEEVKEIWGFAKSGLTNSVNTQPEPAQTREATRGTAKGEPIVINIENTINWYININIDVNLSTELEELINKIIQNQDANFDALFQFLQENGKENRDVILATIKALFEAFEANNNKNIEGLMELLNKLQIQVEDLNGNVVDLTEMVEQLVNNSFEVMEMMGVKLTTIENLLKEQVEQDKMNHKELVETLAMINQAILHLTSRFDEHSETQINQLNAILDKLGKGEVTLQQVLDLLKAIKSDTSENCEVSKAILNAIENLGMELSTQLINIYNKMVENGDNNAEVQKEFLEILNAIKKDTGEIKETNLKILEAIANLDANMVSEATKIYNAILKGNDDVNTKLGEFLEILNAIKKDTGEIKETNLKILEAIANLDANMVSEATKIYNAILKGNNDVSAKLDEFLALLNEIKKLEQEGNDLSKEILAAIKNLGAENIAALKEVIEAINNKKFEVEAPDVTVEVDLKGMETLLKEILAAVNNNTEVDKAGFKAILEKLGNISSQIGNIDLTTIEELLQEIKTFTKDNGIKLDSIITNQDTIIMILESFKKDMTERADEIIAQGQITQTKLDEIIKKLGDLVIKIGEGNCNCDVDGDNLMIMLTEILQAIKDGSCNCDCSHGTGNNEGILEDLDDIFGARKMNTTGINDIEENNNPTDKKIIIVDGRPCVKGEDGKLYDLSGREVK